MSRIPGSRPGTCRGPAEDRGRDGWVAWPRDGPPGRSLESIRIEGHEELDGWRERNLLDPGHAVTGGQEDTLVNERAGAARQESSGAPKSLGSPHTTNAPTFGNRLKKSTTLSEWSSGVSFWFALGRSLQRAASPVQAGHQVSAKRASSFGSTSAYIHRSSVLESPLGRTRHNRTGPLPRRLLTELELPSGDEPRLADLRSGGAPCVADNGAEGPSKSSRQPQPRFIVRSIPAEG